MSGVLSESASLLRKYASDMGILITLEQAVRFDIYRELLAAWNEKMNLTAITNENDIIRKHFLDSISLAPYLPTEPFSAIDVGAGAGFPGLPLAILRDDMQLTLLDALNKRVMFLQEAVEKLSLKSCQPLHARAEDAARMHGQAAGEASDQAAGEASDRADDDQTGYRHREQYDICFARAVAPLAELAEICLAFVKPGGLFFAMKGPDPAAETERGMAAVRIMGGELNRIEKVELSGPGEMIIHSIIIVRKIHHTPPEFPRNPSKIKKSPLL